MYGSIPSIPKVKKKKEKKEQKKRGRGREAELRGRCGRVAFVAAGMRHPTSHHCKRREGEEEIAAIHVSGHSCSWLNTRPSDAHRAQSPPDRIHLPPRCARCFNASWGRGAVVVLLPPSSSSSTWLRTSCFEAPAPANKRLPELMAPITSMAAGDPSEWEAVTSYLQGSSPDKGLCGSRLWEQRITSLFWVLCNSAGEAERVCKNRPKNRWRDARMLGVCIPYCHFSYFAIHFDYYSVHSEL